MKIDLINFGRKYYYLLTAFIVLIIYLFTMAPSVVQIDSGELATVQITLGIAHPTGYPLFSIVGFLFSLIPLPFTKIFQMNLLAAIFCSASVGVFVYTVKLVLDNLEFFNPKESASKEKTKKVKKKEKSKKKTVVTSDLIIPNGVKYLSAVFGGLILAFSKTFWFQSTSVEVYSLHLLLITLIILFLVKAFIKSKSTDKILPWLVFALFLALGFTNHMTTLLILPGVAYLYFLRFGFNSSSIKKVVLMILFFIPVLVIIYSYLPIRASQSPFLNWGNPIDFEGILRHISGKQYQVWLFSSTAAAKKQFIYFVETLPLEFSINLIIAAIGLFASFIKAKKLFIFLIITFFFTILYSINYDIHDIDSYFLLAYICLAFFAVFGVLKLYELTGKIKNIFLLLGILLVVLIIQFYSNFDKVNQHGIYTFEDYTNAVVGSVTEDAIIFSYQWDYFISSSYYYQNVENYRKDVAVIDKELLRRSWYYNQLSNAFPGLFNGVQNDVKEFLKALVPFERSEDFDAQKLETHFRRIMTGLVATNIDEKDFYVAQEIFEQEMQRGEFALPEGYTLVPDLFLFKVVKGNQYYPAPDFNYKIRFPEKRNYYINMIENFVGTMLSRRALYELKFAKNERSKYYVQKIIEHLPNYKLPPVLDQFRN